MISFLPLIEEMEKSGVLYSTPECFQTSMKVIGVKKGQTAPHISIQSFEGLSQELKDYGYMPYRLGSPKGERGTFFTLVNTKKQWSDHFILDDEIFNDKPELFLPTCHPRDLFPFTLLPRLTEKYLVNLAIASGALSHALDLDLSEPISIPATGHTTSSFKFKIHKNDQVYLDHINGQVEIDGILTGKRKGKDVLIIIEAKSDSHKSMPKYKIAYPYYSLKNKIHHELQVICCYIRTEKTKNGYLMKFCETAPIFDSIIDINYRKSTLLSIVI